MANILDNLFGKASETPADLLKKEINGMQLRKQSLLASVQNEMLMLEQQRSGVLIQIGNAMYTAHKENNDVPSDSLVPFYSQIDTLEQSVQEKKTKIDEISARYDDEIVMLTNSLNLVMQPQMPVPGAPGMPPMPGMPPLPGQVQPAISPAPQMFCNECGTKYVPGHNVFCEECGTKL